MSSIGVVASLAIPYTDVERVCAEVRKEIPDAFDKANAPTIVYRRGSDNVLDGFWVIQWRDFAFSSQICEAVLRAVGKDFCLMEICDGGASFAKHGGGELANFFVAKRTVAISDEFDSFQEFLEKGV